METAMPHPLPSAASSFRSPGQISSRRIKYPHLPKSIPVHTPHVTYPGLTKHGMSPKTKIPMGMTLPIMTKAGGHPADTTSHLPMFGHGTH